MRKGAVLLALVMIAAAPSAAFAAKKAAKAPADPNAAGQKLVYNAMMQPYYAWQSVWVVQPAATAKKKK